MKLSTNAFKDGERIPAKFAFCASKTEMGSNNNPDFSWLNLPDGTNSLVFICHDSVVPTSAENVNKEGKVVPADLPRTDFYHWVMVDIPPTREGISEGEFSNGITAKGKQEIHAADGTIKLGKNNYTDWFAGDENMGGIYRSYDGPCPPWNDELVHKYHFTLYALDLSKLDVDDDFGGPEALKAMEGHILAKVSVSGTYTLNPDLI
ncbi:MAG: YbhB/YbcL family Raf kinase inhibitor-like protein [Candidatus Hodarchaeales archaeon]|jgi:Raf kinase inhibitor-like YbhB/YbcL family protein